ncbi:hypothetical protein [Caballeronia sp. CLC5]|uniref:hypothetical protein n=1 Tax=Caballeronia sp. CLC5 TaxID=2906764 RepID=UPI001F260EEB|nr:hypothetical protein [Caballeronia sp. CLC5]MCE4574900.1 hypothetical protein [Caballeronia sp. CLC5]
MCRKFDRRVPVRPPCALLLLASVGGEARWKNDATELVSLVGQVWTVQHLLDVLDLWERGPRPSFGRPRWNDRLRNELKLVRLVPYQVERLVEDLLYLGDIRAPRLGLGPGASMQRYAVVGVFDGGQDYEAALASSTN